MLGSPTHLKIHEGNQATTLVAKKGFLQSTHTQGTSCTHCREQLENDNIPIERVKTDLQSADICTKALQPNIWDGIRVDFPDKLADVREKASAKAAA